MQLTQDIIRYIDDHRQEAFDLLVELAQIPAPPGARNAVPLFAKTGSKHRAHRVSTPMRRSMSSTHWGM